MTAHNNFYNNAVFWVEVDRISPNPYQPRREFDPERLNDLAESIKQYGVLQPLVVTRKEVQRADGSLYVEYELLAGERRLRAAKLAGLTQVPVLIRAKEDTNKVKLEIAIIENLQREDLNPIDRAKAFKQLADEFNLNHTEIAKKIGKSREYVSNSIRLLSLPEDMQQALINKDISEGHARPLLMLSDKPEEQRTLFREIVVKKMTVRDAERAARSIAKDRARKQDLPPELSELERALTEELGTRVQIEKKEKGGKVRIDFFSEEDLYNLLKIVRTGHQQTQAAMSSAAAVIGGLAGVSSVPPAEGAEEQPASATNEQTSAHADAVDVAESSASLTPQPQIQQPAYEQAAAVQAQASVSEAQEQSLQPQTETQSTAQTLQTQDVPKHQPTSEQESHVSGVSGEASEFVPETAPAPAQSLHSWTESQHQAHQVPNLPEQPQTHATSQDPVAPEAADLHLPKEGSQSDQAQMPAFSDSSVGTFEHTASPSPAPAQETPSPDTGEAKQPSVDSTEAHESQTTPESLPQTPSQPQQPTPPTQPEQSYASSSNPDDDLYSIRNFTI